MLEPTVQLCVRLSMSCVACVEMYMFHVVPLWMFVLIGIFGVGKAAVHQPALAVLSHTPEGATETICWVGKGIVYDTGGLSIKGKVSELWCA